MSTYTEVHRRSYLKNKDRIRERNKEYRKAYNHEYYLLNKEKLLANDKKKRILKLQRALLSQAVET